jgi:large subunit ribosomal protein L29
MKPEKIRDLDTTELERQLKDTSDQLFHLRFQMRMGQLEGLKKYRGLRKDRARILTILGERRAAESQKG